MLPVRPLALATLLVLVTGCEAQVEFSLEADAGNPACPAGPASLTALFDRHFAPIRPTGCVTECHGLGSGDFTFAGPAQLWQQAVRVPARSDPSRSRVAPGDLASSVLYQRLLPSAPGLSRMPPGGPYLDAAALAEVAGWICAGAPPSE
jgi:hypothetical protein